MALLSRLRALRRGKSSITGEDSSLQPLHRLSVVPQCKIGSSPAPEPDDIPISQRYAQMAQDPRSSLPSACRRLDPEDVDLFGENPIAAGGVANIWEGTHNGHKVALKSYRCCASSDVAQVVEVRYNRSPYRVYSDSSFAEVPQRSSCVGPPSPTRRGRSTSRWRVLDRGTSFRSSL